MASASAGEEVESQAHDAGSANHRAEIEAAPIVATGPAPEEAIGTQDVVEDTVAKRNDSAEPQEVTTEAATKVRVAETMATILETTHDDAAEGNNKKPAPAVPKKTAAPYRFFAVRKCDGLQAPAIFLSLDDCNFYVDKEENDTPAVFEEFSTLEGATKYIYSFIIAGCDGDLDRDLDADDLTSRFSKKRKLVSIDVVGTQRLRKARRKANTKKHTNKRKDTASGGQKDWLEQYDEMVKLAQEYKEAHGDCNVPLTEQFGKLGFWVQKARYFSQLKLDGQPSFLTRAQTNTLVDLGIVKSEEEHKLQQSMERQERKLERHKNYLEATWGDMIQQIHEYKAETGNTKIPLSFADPQKVKYAELSKWLQKVRKYKKDYMECATSSPLSEDQAIQLTELGLIASKSEKDENAFNLGWPEMMKELSMFKDEFGHCEVPVNNKKGQRGRYENLSKWVNRVRTHMKTHEEAPETSLLDEDKIAELRVIGFAFKYKRGVKGKRPREEIQEFEEYVEILREFTEAKKPINRSTRLQWWVAKQRKEYEEFKNNRPSTMDIRRVTRLTEAGFVFDAKKTQSWEERALNWFQFKTKHGTDPKRYSEDGLGKWVTEQRFKYNRYKQGLNTNLTEEQIKKLTEWGFSWESKVKQPAVKASKEPWEVRYQQLIQWKEEHGHCIVPQHFPVLGQWVHGQRNEYRKVKRGQKSPMTKERIEKLEAIGFVFYTGRGGGVRTPESVARRLNQSADPEPDPFTAQAGINPHIMHYYR